VRHARRAKLRANMERWLRTMSERPNRIRVGQNLLEALDLKLRNNRLRKGRRTLLRAGTDNRPRRHGGRAGADMR
jgi:hypothetical protein